MPAVDLNPAPNRPRWRVVLVRLPPDRDALSIVLPRERPIAAEELPLVLRVTPDLDTAQQTADRLRAAGAAVTVLEDPGFPHLDAFCPDHPTALASALCVACNRRICPSCALAAGGAFLCPTCHQQRQEARQRVRTRQLFSVFLFTAFLYQVHSWLLAERQRVSPLGPVTVGLFQIVPPGQSGAPLVRALNGQPVAGYTGPTLRDIEGWFGAEHERYTGHKGPYLRLQLRGPWEERIDPPPLALPDDGLFTLAFRSWRFAQYFKDLVTARGVDLSATAVRVFVIYGSGEGDLASHSRGSEKGRIAMAWLDLAERNPAYAVLTVAHELAHTLGAEDLYEEGSYLARYPEGYVQPHLEPRYPQRYAELMAVDIPVGPSQEAEPASLDQLRIGYHSAATMGWIAEEEARWFYEYGGEQDRPDAALDEQDK